MSILVPLISEHCGQMAVDAFASVLDMHKWVALSSGGARARRGAPPNPNPDPTEAPRNEAAPPYALMDHAPLATLTNSLLGAMNELRHCAPLALAAPCAQALQDGLARAAAAMADYQATRPLGPGEAGQAAAAAEALVTVVCPYAVACLGRIFPGAAGHVDLRAATAPLAPGPPALGFLGSGLGSGGGAAGKVEARSEANGGRNLGEAGAPPAQQPAHGKGPEGAASGNAPAAASGPVAARDGMGAGSSGSRDPLASVT